MKKSEISAAIDSSLFISDIYNSIENSKSEHSFNKNEVNRFMTNLYNDIPLDNNLILEENRKFENNNGITIKDKHKKISSYSSNRLVCDTKILNIKF